MKTTNSYHSAVKFHAPLKSLSFEYFGEAKFDCALPIKLQKEKYDEGYNEAKKVFEAQLKSQSEQWDNLYKNALNSIDEKYDLLVKDLKNELPTFVVKILEHLMKNLPAPKENLIDFVKETLNEASSLDEPLKLLISDKDESLLSEIDALAKEKFSKLNVAADKNISPGNCVLTTKWGLIENGLQSRVEKLQNLISQA